MNIEDEWNKAQIFEKNWWMNYTQYHTEEIEKGDIVGRLLFADKGAPTKTVIDIGSGPFSLLHRVPVKEGTALDPIYYDQYEQSYADKGIKRLVKCGEDLNPADGTFDEAWIYNCLQHVKNPFKILENAISVSSTVRIFEWTHIKPYEGHLHELTPELLSAPFKIHKWNTLMESKGVMGHSGLYGQYYMAIFSKNPAEQFKL